ncbi:unnamed protein product, partial [Trichogramma brassicae]
QYRSQVHVAAIPGALRPVGSAGRIHWRAKALGPVRSLLVRTRESRVSVSLLCVCIAHYRRAADAALLPTSHEADAIPDIKPPEAFRHRGTSCGRRKILATSCCCCCGPPAKINEVVSLLLLQRTQHAATRHDALLHGRGERRGAQDHRRGHPRHLLPVLPAGGVRLRVLRGLRPGTGAAGASAATLPRPSSSPPRQSQQRLESSRQHRRRIRRGSRQVLLSPVRLHDDEHDAAGGGDQRPEHVLSLQRRIHPGTVQNHCTSFDQSEQLGSKGIFEAGFEHSGLHSSRIHQSVPVPRQLHKLSSVPSRCAIQRIARRYHLYGITIEEKTWEKRNEANWMKFSCAMCHFGGGAGALGGGSGGVYARSVLPLAAAAAVASTQHVTALCPCARADSSRAELVGEKATVRCVWSAAALDDTRGTPCSTRIKRQAALDAGSCADCCVCLETRGTTTRSSPGCVQYYIIDFSPTSGKLKKNSLKSCKTLLLLHLVEVILVCKRKKMYNK